MSERAGAVLVAAGASRRMGFDKLWAPLGERPVLSYALRVLAGCAEIARVVLVVAGDRLDDARRLATEAGGSIALRLGGVERRDSVAAGLEALADCEWVVVHDAARPFVTKTLVRAGLLAARATGAAVAALPCRETVKRVDGQTVLCTLDRASLWSVQTPQVFRRGLLLEALAEPGEVTDEATLVERRGAQVAVYLGSELNWKITTPADLELARAWVAHRSAVGSPERKPSGGH